MIDDEEPTRPIALPPACSFCGIRGAHERDCKSVELDERALAQLEARWFWISIKRDTMRIVGDLAIGARSRGSRFFWKGGEVAP